MVTLDDLFTGQGEMNALMRSLDWSKTPVGSVEQWSQSLRTAVSICLGSRYPIEIWWGPDYIRFYNDAYRPILGQTKHPQYLGRPGRECWAEIWEVVGPLLDSVRETGQSTWSEDLLLPMTRNGYVEETYFTFSYSPIRDESGGVGGIFCACRETTEKVVGERRLRSLRELAVNTAGAKSVVEACQMIASTLSNNLADLPFALLYLMNPDGNHAYLAGASGIEAGTVASPEQIELIQGSDAEPESDSTLWHLSQVQRSGQPQQVNHLTAQWGELPRGDWSVSPDSALVMPLLQTGQQRPLMGFLVLGISPRRAFDDDYRGFFDLVASHISTTIANAHAYEKERKRVEALAELNQLRHEALQREQVLRAESEQNEIRLQEHQHLLQQVTDTMPGILYVYDLSLQQNVYVNYQVSDLLGYTPEQVQMLGVQLFLRLVHPDDVKTFPDHVRRFASLQDSEVLETEYRLRSASGEWRWFSGREIIFSRNPDGSPRQILGSAYDVTARKQAEEALRREKERFELATTAVDCLIYDWSITTQTVEHSEGLTRIFGYLPEETEPNRDWWTARIHPEDVQQVLDQIAKDLTTRDRYAIEYRVRNKYGQYLYVLDQGFIVRGQNGQPVRVVGSTTDISDRKITEKLQQFLLEINDLLRTLDDPQDIIWAVVHKVGSYFDITRSSYCEIDTQQECVTVNRDFCQQAGDRLGRHRMDEFGPEIVSVLRHGTSLVIDDIQTDPRTAPHQAAFAEIDTRAILCVPLFKQERYVALFILRHAQPRNWLSEEIVLMEEVAERTWMAIEKVRAEQALRQSEARFQRLATNVPGVICRYLLYANGPEKMPYISPSCRNLLELEAETVQQDVGTLWALVHPEDIDSLREIIAVSAQTQQPIHWEGQFTMPSGRSKWIQFVARPQQQPDGSVLWDGLLTDITGTKEVEIEREHLMTRLQQSANQFRGLTEASLVMNSILSVEEVLQAVTQQAYSIIGAHQVVTSLVENLDWTTAKHAIYLSEKYAAWQDYTTDPTGDGIYSCACRLNQPMRMTQAELEAHPHWQGFSQESENHPPLRGWLAAPLTGRDGKNIGLIQLSDKYTGEFTESDEDILVQLAQMASVAIENTRLYEAEQHARTQAESVNRIKDEFLAVLSHELRSPLNPILGWSRLMRNRKLDENTISCALETIERNAKLQTQLIEDLLDVSRILQGKMSLSIAPVDMATTIDSAMEIVRLAAEAKSIDLSVEIPNTLDQKTASPSPNSSPPFPSPPAPTPFTVLGDCNRLQQVIWNLLSNAVKFTPTGGAVRIKLESKNSQVIVTVTDTGKGIEPEFLPHLFEYFRQEDGATTRKFGGLGLGLAIVRHIIELHGGTINADSPGANQGSTFVVQLPLLKQRQGAMIAGDRNLSQSLDGTFALEGLQILVVDDDSDSRDLIQFVLEQMGAIVTSVESAMAALQSLGQSSYDVLISDIGMPEVDGYMLMHQVRSLYSNRNAQISEQVVIPKTIALTAYAGEYNCQRAIKAGFQKHLSKPVEPGELIQTIINLTK